MLTAIIIVTLTVMSTERSPMLTAIIIVTLTVMYALLWTGVYFIIYPYRCNICKRRTLLPHPTDRTMHKLYIGPRHEKDD